jgi:hypothetical protein
VFGFGGQRARSGAEHLPEYIPLKSNEAAFKFACKLHPDEISEGTGHVGLVLDSKILIGADVSVKVQSDGRQLTILKIANSDGGFVVPAMTAIKNAPALKPGDLVMWVAGQFLPDLAEKLGDPRKGWVGLIFGVLAPEMRADNGAFRVAINYYDLLP